MLRLFGFQLVRIEQINKLERGLQDLSISVAELKKEKKALATKLASASTDYLGTIKASDELVMKLKKENDQLSKDLQWHTKKLEEAADNIKALSKTAETHEAHCITLRKALQETGKDRTNVSKHVKEIRKHWMMYLERMTPVQRKKLADTISNQIAKLIETLDPKE